MNANTGHGHVWQRPDGLKARCGGPGLCAECSRDARNVAFSEGSQDLVHSDPFVVMFLGYLTARIKELHQVHPDELLRAWAHFKAEQGKNPDGTRKVEWR